MTKQKSGKTQTSNKAYLLAKFRQGTPPQTLTVNTHQWSYYACGDDAEAVIILHGGGGDAEAMFPYMMTFAEAYRVIAPNLPRSVRTMEDAVQGVRAIMAQEGLRKAHVVGFAFGGLVAQMLIRRFPDVVENLVLTHAVIPSDHLLERVQMQISLMTLYPNALMMRFARRSYRRDIAGSSTPAPAEDRQFWQDYFTELYRTRFDKGDLLARARATADYHAAAKFQSRDLNGWYGDLLLIESSHDNVISAGDRGAIKGMYPRAFLQKLWGYDHLAPLLACDEIAQSIKNFLVREDDES